MDKVLQTFAIAFSVLTLAVAWAVTLAYLLFSHPLYATLIFILGVSMVITYLMRFDR